MGWNESPHSLRPVLCHLIYSQRHSCFLSSHLKSEYSFFAFVHLFSLCTKSPSFMDWFPHKCILTVVSMTLPLKKEKKKTLTFIGLLEKPWHIFFSMLFCAEIRHDFFDNTVVELSLIWLYRMLGAPGCLDSSVSLWPQKTQYLIGWELFKPPPLHFLFWSY